MNQTSFSRASLARRLEAVFADAAWHRLPGQSDLTLAEGRIAGRAVLLVATDPAIQLGTFGMQECADFRSALQRARADGAMLVLLIDSAGARLNAGLPIQGALRGLMRDLLDARLDGLPVLAALGRYAFGAASMLACAASRRLHASDTLTAMSGPKVLAAQPANPVDADVLQTVLDGSARCGLIGLDEAGNADRLIADSLSAYAAAVRDWVQAPGAATIDSAALQQQRHRLRLRWHADNTAPPAVLADGAQDGAQLVWRGGPLGVAGVLALCERVEHGLRAAPQAPLTIAIDCPGHSTALRDEQAFLSQYLVHLALSLRYATRHGADLRFLIERQVAGGVYIALAAGAGRTELAAGATVQTLPATALSHILGDAESAVPDSAAHREWGVVDVVHPETQASRHGSHLEAGKLTLA